MLCTKLPNRQFNKAAIIAIITAFCHIYNTDYRHLRRYCANGKRNSICVTITIPLNGHANIHSMNLHLAGMEWNKMFFSGLPFGSVQPTDWIIVAKRIHAHRMNITILVASKKQIDILFPAHSEH